MTWPPPNLGLGPTLDTGRKSKKSRPKLQPRPIRSPSQRVSSVANVHLPSANHQNCNRYMAAWNRLGCMWWFEYLCLHAFLTDRSFAHSMEEKIWQFVFDGHFRNVTDWLQSQKVQSWWGSELCHVPRYYRLHFIPSLVHQQHFAITVTNSWQELQRFQFTCRRTGEALKMCYNRPALHQSTNQWQSLHQRHRDRTHQDPKKEQRELLRTILRSEQYSGCIDHHRSLDFDLIVCLLAVLRFEKVFCRKCACHATCKGKEVT